MMQEGMACWGEDCGLLLQAVFLCGAFAGRVIAIYSIFNGVNLVPSQMI